ncbi:MAG: M1 family metallopeptidase [Anaerolineae bacterium]|nr:M1 family metallopeptidase [Anaerolineae bacterium]
MLHYTLDLRFTLDTPPQLAGIARLTVRTQAENLAAFSLDLVGLTVEAVRVQGAPVEFEQRDRKLFLPLPFPLNFGTEFAVEVDYGGSLRPLQSPYAPFIGGIGLLSSQRPPALAFAAQPDAARSWFPSNDHPLDAATYDFVITVAQPLEAIANGTPGPVTENDDGTRTFRYAMTDPMASYLATVAIADYQVLETVQEGVPLRHYAPIGDSPDAVAAAFSTTDEALEALGEVFGPYPFEFYGHAITPLRGGALETQP